MIIGHLGVALAARSRWKYPSLAALVAASFTPDLWRLVLALTGMHWTRTNLYSHALPWSALLALFATVVARKRLGNARAALIVGGLIASHIALDFVSGSKPLWEGGPKGLGLAAVQQLELVLEAALMWVGWRLFRATGERHILRSRTVLSLAILLQLAALLITLGDRPYRIRCLAYPLGRCIPDGPLMQRNWNTGLYPQ